MITSLRLINFKNFADETLRVGPFTVIVGANASGKSNIRDAFRFLHGIGRGYTLAEILGGKIGAGGQLEWEPIRGAPSEIVRFEPVFVHSWSPMTLTVEMDLNDQEVCYSIKVGYNPHSSEQFRVEKETLTVDSECVFDTFNDTNGRTLSVKLTSPEERVIPLDPTSPVLTRLQALYWGSLPNLPNEVISLFHNTQFLEFSPEHLRQPSRPGGSVLGESGRNLPSAVEAICQQPEPKRTLLSWLHELIPMDVQNFEFQLDAEGQTQLFFVEKSGRKVSADSASDGTLRFLGILTALLARRRRSIYVFEDLDAGIHPARLWLLLDFIESETARGHVQVLTTTHSPALLTWMNDSTFEHTSVVYRDDYWTDSIIRPIAGLYNLRDLRKSTTLGELFSSNWIGEAMKFSEGEPDSDYLDDDEDGDEQ